MGSIVPVSDINDGRHLNHMGKQKFLGFTLLTTVLSSIMLVLADNDGYEGGFGEFGKGLGSFAVGMLLLGSSYVIFRRGYVLAKKVGLTEDKNYGNYIKEAYKQLRGPMMIVHLFTNIAATVFGALHGLSMTRYTQLTYYSGWIAVIAMAVLSISGIIIYFKFRPFWKYRESRTFIRFLHRQWIISVILVFSVVLHLAVAEDD